MRAVWNWRPNWETPWERNKKAKITLIDRNPTHIWKPRLHEVATGALNATLDELSYAAHAHQHYFEFVLGEMAGLDRKSKAVKLAPYMVKDEQVLPSRSIHYDKLIISVGSQTNDFGTPGAKEHCLFLDRREAAEQFHQSFLNIYLKASSNGDTRENTFNIAIVGAGATGVELAAELNHAAHHLADYGFQGIKPENVTISIIEASDRVLPVLSPKASQAILKQLQVLNINVLTQESVSKVTAEGFYTKSNKFIPAQLMVWSAGVKAPGFLRDLDGLETNRINQLVVHNTLQSTQDEDIFAFGDCAQCPAPSKDNSVKLFVPPRAQAAHQQAKLLTKSIIGIVNGKPPLPFIYKDKGSLVSLGKTGSIGNIMGNLSQDFTFEGKLAPAALYLSIPSPSAGTARLAKNTFDYVARPN